MRFINKDKGKYSHICHYTLHGGLSIETDDLKILEEKTGKEADLQKILKKAGITEDVLDKAKNLKRLRDFKRDLPVFKKKKTQFQEELQRYRKTGRKVNKEKIKNNLKEAELLEITMNGREVKKRFLKDKLDDLKEEESRLAKEAEKLNIKFNKELEGIEIE